ARHSRAPAWRSRRRARRSSHRDAGCDCGARVARGRSDRGRGKRGDILPRLLRPPRTNRAEMIIAIDGPAGAGKSTVARLLAERPDIGADALATDLRARDESDRARMQPAADAELIDTTELEVDDVVDHIQDLIRSRSLATP